MNVKTFCVFICFLGFYLFLSGCGNKNTLVGRVSMQGYLNPFQMNIQDGCITNTDEQIKSFTWEDGKCKVELVSSPIEKNDNIIISED